MIDVMKALDERLKLAIEQLKPEYRSVLLLWGVEGMKYREIAMIHDVPIGTIMSRLHRARSLLAEQLADLAEENRLGNGCEQGPGTPGHDMGMIRQH